MRILNNFILGLALVAPLFAQIGNDCGFADVDINSIDVLSNEYYSYDVEFICEPIGGVEFGLKQWPVTSPFVVDSLYSIGDKIIWGTTLNDTALYICTQNLPSSGILPSDQVYWVRDDTSAVLFNQQVAIDSSLSLPLHISATFQYHHSLVNKTHKLVPYRIDSDGNIDLFDMDIMVFNLPFLPGDLAVESSDTVWNYDYQTNLYDNYSCLSDTLWVSATVTEYFGAPVTNLYLGLFAPGGITSQEIQRTNDGGQCTWGVQYPISLIAPNDSCVYQSYIASQLITTTVFPYFQGANAVELIREDGNCDSCPGFSVGCTDSAAWNWNPGANQDDGSCLYRGDVNADQSLNILDLTIMIDVILSEIQATEFELWASDINGDGTVTVIDIVLLIEWILG